VAKLYAINAIRKCKTRGTYTINAKEWNVRKGDGAHTHSVINVRENIVEGAKNQQRIIMIIVTTVSAK
jgi:hypothetical protein